MANKVVKRHDRVCVVVLFTWVKESECGVGEEDESTPLDSAIVVLRIMMKNTVEEYVSAMG